MKKWTGGLMITTLALILFLSYTFIGKHGSPTTKKQSAYDFFNNHHDINSDEETPSLSNTHNAESADSAKEKEKEKRLEHLAKKPVFVDFEGLNDLYSLSNNAPKRSSEALLVWNQMRFLLTRSDALPGLAQGIREAAIVWKDLVSKDKDLEFLDGENVSCPYFVTTSLGNGSFVEIPCGLVEDSSVTVIGVPELGRESFEIELVGSEIGEEEKGPVVLNYKVVLPGENLTKEALIVQNTWSEESGWGNEETCPNCGSTDGLKVDGLVKCNTQLTARTAEENNNTTRPSDGRATNITDMSPHEGYNFPFVEGYPFTATLWTGEEGFHMTVNGRHETSFAYREKLEPWLVNRVCIKGGLDLISILAKGLPVSGNLDFVTDAENLKAPSLVSNKKKRVVLFVGVFSTGNNFERRMALRRSWMQYDAVRSGEVAVRFFIGLHKSTEVNFGLWKEAQAYGDIQLMPFVDYYSLLTYKTVAICIMGTTILPAKYIMKTDDDAFVRIDEVLLSLKGKGSAGLLYGKISYESSPHRDKDNKWYISEEEWPHSLYPPWAHGPGYVISRDIAKFIVQSHRERELELFKLEDVAVGIWIEQFEKKHGRKVEYVNNDRFYNAGCDMNYVLAHYQNPRMMLCLWEKLQKEHQPNCCE